MSFTNINVSLDVSGHVFDKSYVTVMLHRSVTKAPSRNLEWLEASQKMDEL